MKTTTNIMLFFIFIIFLNSCKEVNVTEDNEKNEKIIYTMGVSFGERLKDMELTSKEKEVLTQGVIDGLEKKPQIDIKKYASQIRSLFRERGQKMAKKMEEIGAEYMKKFVADEGGEKTESGIGYKILKEGTGNKPKASDRVKVHYHGTLVDGTVFDSSVERKKPLTFPLGGVIKCWREGLQSVKVGGKMKLVCPSNVAYGIRGAPPKIPGGSTLIFEVELLEIVSGQPDKKQGDGVGKKEKGRKKKGKKERSRK